MTPIQGFALGLILGLWVLFLTGVAAWLVDKMREWKK